MAACLLLMLLMLESLSASDASQLPGCYNVSSDVQTESLQNETTAISVVTDIGACSVTCGNKSAKYFGIKARNNDVHCRCISDLDEGQRINDHNCTESSSLEDCVPASNQFCWLVFLTGGNYLTDLHLQLDGNTVMKDSPVFLEVIAMVTSFVNNTDSELKSSQGEVNVTWRFGDNSSNVFKLQADDQGQVYHRVKHKYVDTGTYYVEVTIENEVSSVRGQGSVEVLYPKPRNLQLFVKDGLYDEPSCIPQEYAVEKSDGPTISVFVDTTLCLEASVSTGKNLTFTFWFGDTQENFIKHPCKNKDDIGYHSDDDLEGLCMEAVQDHMFQQTGIHSVGVIVTNRYGALVENITVIVIDKVLTGIEPKIHPESNSIVAVDTEVKFLVSMEMTSRNNTYLRVDYGDGTIDVVSMMDTNTSAMVLQGEGHNMEIVDSYGDGCRLVVEFQHIYGKEGLYRPTGTVFRNDSFSFSNSSRVMAQLESGILVVKELIGLRLQAPMIVLCYQTVDFVLQFASKFNLTVDWMVEKLADSDEMDVIIMDNFTSSSTLFSYQFMYAGTYVIRSQASNAASRASASVGILVQCPIHNLWASCEQDYVETMDALLCFAGVESGTDVIFTWQFEGPVMASYRYSGNSSATIRHRFMRPGLYDISVFAVNNVSTKVMYEFDIPITVQDPVDLSQIRFYRDTKTLLGNMTKFAAVYSPPCSNIEFEFDFGEGRKRTLEDWFQNDDDKCYVLERYMFDRPGVHEVSVYAYNRVSTLNETLEVWVIPRLDNITIAVIGVPVVEIPTIFVVQENGVVMETDNVYFEWLFEDGQVNLTNSPVFEKMFTTTGNHSVMMWASNPLTATLIQLTVDVKERSEVNMLLKHDLVVAPATEVNFFLNIASEGPHMEDSKMFVTYTDGTEDMFHGSQSQWSHLFHEPGLYQINITLMASDGIQTEAMTSYLMVEQPITGVELTGPVTVTFLPHDVQSSSWELTMLTGTHCLYRWSVEEEVITTQPRFEVAVSQPGLYVVSVEVFNDLTPPTTVSLPIIVEQPIMDVIVNIHGNLVGKETIILVTVNSSTEFFINVDFGDGSHKEIDSRNLVVEFDQVNRDASRYMVLNHVYSKHGEYDILVNVSNNVSHIQWKEKFVPIGSITLTSRSARISEAPAHVVVMAIVDCDEELYFHWDFSDRYDDMLNEKRYPNQTSIASHLYAASGDYVVKFNVTGRHYPPPGVSVSLPYNFTVVELIEMVQIHHEVQGDSSVGVGNLSAEIIFSAKSSGSHVNFIFDFGDGEYQEVRGSETSFLLVDFSRSAVVSHVYKQVGEYKVKVTAINPLGNITNSMSRPFCVEEPPTNLSYQVVNVTFSGLYRAYPTRFGDIITFKAGVSSGTNVTFNWKLGDQTDIIRAGPMISHQYRSIGEKTVHLIAKNRVHQLYAVIKVLVDQEIQRVLVKSEKSLAAVGDNVLFHAEVRPDHGNVSHLYYKWKINGMGDRMGKLSNKMTEEPVIVNNFQTSGYYSVLVSAVNAISEVMSSPMHIHIMAPVENLQIEVKGHPLTSEPLQLKHYSYSGSDLNFTWNFGDGSPELTTKNNIVTHNYTRSEEYTVSLTAFNTISRQTATKKIFVLDEPYCKEPEVRILSLQNEKIYHSKQLTIEAKVRHECNISTSMTHHWMILNDNQQEVLTSKQRVLILPPRTLHYGKYFARLKVEIQNTIVYGQEEVEFDVVPSPLISMVTGGVFRRVSVMDTMVVDGSKSRDPDGIDTDNLRYHWLCRYQTRYGGHGEGCFHTENNDTVTVDGPFLEVTVQNLIEASNFTFELTVSADGRENSTSFQTIEIVQNGQNVLNVKIRCLQCSFGPVNSDRKLSFSVDCENCPEGEVYFHWSMLHVAGENLFIPARAHDDTECVLPDGASYSPYKLVEKQQLMMQTEEIKRKVESEAEEKRKTASASGNMLKTSIKDWNMDGAQTVTVEPQKPPWEMVSEGPSNGVNRRRRRDNYRAKRQAYHTVSDLHLNDTSKSGLIVPKEGESRGRSNRGRDHSSYPPVAENTENSVVAWQPSHDNAQDSLPIAFQEGSPGEFGSSVGRDSGIAQEVTEEVSNPRFLHFDRLETRIFDSSGASQGDYVVNLESVVPGRKLTILDQVSLDTGLREEDTLTGLNAASLVIRPGVLKQGLAYIVLVKLTGKDQHFEGEARTSFTVNESPVYGECTINEESGVELETEFTVHCKDWQDQHGPLMYEISYKLEKTGRKNLIYRGLDRQSSFQLPSGLPINDYNVFLSIDILDGLLAKTSVCNLLVRVQPQKIRVPSATASLRPEKTTESSLESELQLIHHEATEEGGRLEHAMALGDNAMSRVYISYLATWLNRVSNSNSSARDHQIHVNIRRQLLKTLSSLPVRDEGELLQTVQALSYTLANTEELDQYAVDRAIAVLKSMVEGLTKVYDETLSPEDSFLPLALDTVSSVFTVLSKLKLPRKLFYIQAHKEMISEAESIVHGLLLNELKHHVVDEKPVETQTEFFSIFASRHMVHTATSVQINTTKFSIPSNLGDIIEEGAHRNQSAEYLSANQNCFQSHMTSFKKNPFSFGKAEKVQPAVSSLSLFSCDGKEIKIKNLSKDHLIQVELPNNQPPVQTITQQVLKKWIMNIHQFNVSVENFQHALHLVVDLVPVHQGRLFPITVLISRQTSSLTGESDLYKYDLPVDINTLDIFLPPGSLNISGTYHIRIVDSTYNAGRHRPGEVTERVYQLKLWWGECLYWDIDREAWLPDGCQISQSSTFKVTRCSCNHLTTFGSHFDLVPNKLVLVDVESFFSLNENPVTLTLIGVILFLYVSLLIICRHADRHDAKKAGIVYLLDNTPIDQQKYEITVVTGFRKGAGTSAKISLILHGEEGMSETRELISEDRRPLFERNSRDKFILTLPDSIGKIWKVQLWHNNFGSSPSWYLSRVIVRDLNAGSVYYFLCEKWLAVEEEDGKVEREFTALDGPLAFATIFWSKGTEYMADFHTWTSVLTCPSYSSFQRTERLTCCLTVLMMYMCLNAMWYRTVETEYRGEFGLLDVSLRNVIVGAVCCACVIPVSLTLEFLFRRSKPEKASKCHSSDETEELERVYPSGKPTHQESEDSSEHVPPIMTYSLLDQSILNWPNIQHWAQRQWLKRQQSVGSASDTNSGNSVGSNHNSCLKPQLDHSKEALLSAEMDQASSGFEDSNSLIRPQASADSARTTAAPSVAESMRTHKPASLVDSLRALKPPSLSDSMETHKAPSVTSSCSQKSSVFADRRDSGSNISCMYLPFWCRYLAWSLSALICVTSATITIMYGFRFGITKSTMWLQSLYFSFMICVFIANPVMILLAVIFSALKYKNDPSVFDHSDTFSRDKIKDDLNRWRRRPEVNEDCDVLERGVAARQRSRYLRFARPPQEKQLIETRKKILKEKKAISVFRDSVGFFSLVLLLIIMAYGKDTSSHFYQNSAVKDTFTRSDTIEFNQIHTRDDWYRWASSSLLHSLHATFSLSGSNTTKQQNYMIGDSCYIIGDVMVRQYKVKETPCSVTLPYITTVCRHEYTSSTRDEETRESATEHVTDEAQIHGEYGIYSGSGNVVILNKTRSEAVSQFEALRNDQWLDRKSRAVLTEFTVYNVQNNLFTSVNLLLEFPPTGGAVAVVKVMSTLLFRYVTAWDQVILACELMFFVLMLYKIKKTACFVIEHQRKYVENAWNILEMVSCVLALAYGACYVYRFVLVSRTVEALRSSYYEQFVDVSFIAFWDELLRSAVAVLLFLAVLKCLQLLRYNKLCAVFGRVYLKAQKDILVFLMAFLAVVAAYTSLGHAIFATVSRNFRDLWSSLSSVSALLVGRTTPPELSNHHQETATNVFISTFFVFSTGFLTAYIIAVLSHQFRSRKKRRHLAMSGKEVLVFYWDQFQRLLRIKTEEYIQEPEVILPPEFTMAEIEYQVEELLFRMNALTGSHGLPEKPPCYLTDSDCTYGAGDDGISSGGSEGHQFGEDRLEQRVQKIEDNLCSQEPFLAQLLKLDSLGDEDLCQEKEKQLRSHLELEIFRQLQLQRQVVKEPSGGEQDKKGDHSEGDGPNSDKRGSASLSVQDADQLNSRVGTGPQDLLTRALSHCTSGTPNSQGSCPLQPNTTSLTIQTLQDLISKSSQEVKACSTGDQSSSQMDSYHPSNIPENRNRSSVDTSLEKSPTDIDRLIKAVEMKTRKSLERTPKQKSPNSSTEKMSPELTKYQDKDLGGGSSDSVEISRKVTKKPEPPVKPTFLQASLRDASLTEASCKGSPVLKLRPGVLSNDRGSKSDNSGGSITTDTSSGSEQDGIHCARKLIAKRNLRKTKSRGKGKGPDSLAPALLLDELEVEEGETHNSDMPWQEKQETIPEQIPGETEL